MNVPEDNPTTEEGVLLGKYLFYEGRFSGRTHPDSLMSCSSCHIQSSGFECGPDHPRFVDGNPIGLPDSEAPNGRPTPHHMLPLVNLIYNPFGYLWNGEVYNYNEALGSDYYNVPEQPEFGHKNIEAIVWMTIVNEAEVNGSIEKTVKTISEIPEYEELFKNAFGSSEVTIDRIKKAIAQFVRTIISYRSKYHQWLRREAELTDSELRGYELFFSEEGDCFHCHGGTLLTTNFYYNNAKDLEFTDPFDRYGFTGDPADIGAYKAPSLLNVEVRGPYMHDGRFKTLEEVIDFYSEGLVDTEKAHPLMKQVKKGGVQLSDQGKEDLLAFLKTFTDHELLNDPAFSKP